MCLRQFIPEATKSKGGGLLKKRVLTKNFHVWNNGALVHSALTHASAWKFVADNGLDLTADILHRDKLIYEGCKSFIGVPTKPKVEPILLADCTGPFMFAEDNGFNRGTVFMPSNETVFAYVGKNDRVEARPCYILICEPPMRVGDCIQVLTRALVVPVQVKLA